jgi:hypothetical protein
MLYLFSQLGRTAVITDDGAYRRLYHGYEDEGEASSVAIWIRPDISGAQVLPVDAHRLEPEYLVCVTTGRVPAFTTHLIVLTGYDRTFDAGNAHSKADLAGSIDVSLVDSDKVISPPNLPLDSIRELIVSATPVKSKSALSVCLKDGLLMHAARCEESKQLVKPASQDFSELLARLLSPFVIPNAADIAKILGLKTSAITTRKRSK